MHSHNKKVLIAGYTGFIGSHLIKEMKADNSITIIPLSRSNGFDLAGDPKIFDIECDVIVNLAGVVGIDRSWKEPKDFYKDNYLTTLNLLELARKNSASIVHISSYVYGVPQYLPVDEKHPIQGYNPYASSKILSEELCKDYGRYYDIPVTILRPFNVYGTNQSSQFLLSRLIDSAINGNNVDIHDMSAKRDYLWVEDLAHGISKVVSNQKKGVNIYNIGSGISHSAKEAIDIITSKSSNPNYSIIGRDSSLLVNDCVCDYSLFSRDYMWHPKVSLEEGLSRMINHLK